MNYGPYFSVSILSCLTIYMYLGVFYVLSTIISVKILGKRNNHNTISAIFVNKFKVSASEQIFFLSKPPTGYLPRLYRILYYVHLEFNSTI